MQAQVTSLITEIKQNHRTFKEVIEWIDTYYQHQPTAFRNGANYNEAHQNQGSAKVFAFAMLHHLSEADTVFLFAEHYKSVLDNPDGTDHQNIRQFMVTGWSGIVFEGEALIKR